MAAFDKPLDIPGLWDGIRISTVHKMLDIECDKVSLFSIRSCTCSRYVQEALHYLELIRKTFHRIFDRVLREDETAR